MLRALMKKHCAATLGIGVITVLAGCASTSEEPESPTARQAMRFGVKIDESRAIVTNETLKADGESFSVWSTFSRDDEEQTVAPILLFDGETVTRSEGTWSYENTQYWFPKFTHYFVGLYPSEATGVSSYKFENNSLSFDFTYPTDYTNTPDLLTATHTRLYLEENDNSDAVTLGFSHILSRLNFVCTIGSAEEMKINRLTIRNINTKGSYAIAPSDLAGEALETNDFTGGEWSVSAPGVISIPLNETIAGGTTQSFFSEGDNALMIIPQTVPADVEVEVVYTVGVETKTVTAKLHDTTVNAHEGVWKKGRSYSYSFTLTQTHNENVNFTSSAIQGWNEAEGGNYIIIEK